MPEHNGHTNGTQTAASKPAVYQIRVFRVEEGDAVIARFLSYSHLGIMTHYVRKRSLYCPGDAECCPANHRLDKFWKTYAAVELWNDARKVWFPTVLEVTEHLELDLRDICKRGQLWELWRHKGGSKSSPVEAKLLEERDPETMPRAFDFMPVLQHLYHVSRIQLSVKNPLPPRVVVAESIGDGPAILSQPEKVDNGPRFNSFAEEARRRLMERKKTPTEKKVEAGT